ncbi:hypothetical protein cypCar_00028275 [Cyprinus carpio]|nr:hypothetical protein cypCar_00028275 [Cyprinus carpio]
MLELYYSRACREDLVRVRHRAESKRCVSSVPTQTHAQ